MVTSRMQTPPACVVTTRTRWSENSRVFVVTAARRQGPGRAGVLVQLPSDEEVVRHGGAMQVEQVLALAAVAGPPALPVADARPGCAPPPRVRAAWPDRRRRAGAGRTRPGGAH